MNNIQKIAQKSFSNAGEFYKFAQWALKGNYQNLSMYQFIHIYSIKNKTERLDYKKCNPINVIDNIIMIYKKTRAVENE